MQLNEIFEENTLESISQRTRIPAEILDQLRQCDIASFQKVQLLGFISILEREYRVDLGAFRQECLAAFGAKPQRSEPTDQQSSGGEAYSPKPLIVNAEGERPPRSLKPVGVFVLVAALLYGAWLTFSTTRSGSDINQTSGEDVGFFTAVTDRIKQQLGGDDTSDMPSNASQEENTSVARSETGSSRPVGDKSSSSDAELEQMRQIDDRIAQTDVQEDGPKKVAEALSETKPDVKELSAEVPSLVQETVSKDSDAPAGDLTDQEAARQAEAKRQIAMEAQRKAAEEAAQKEAEAARQAAAERARKEEEARQRAVELARQKEEAAARKRAEEEAARKKAEAARKKAEEQARKEAEARKAEAARKKAAAEAGTVTLMPHAKVWLGIVDLETMKRRVVTTQSPIAFKNPDGRWLVATGHGRFGLKIGSRKLDFGDNKKHFLLIENGTVREVSHERFQQLNKSKVW